MNVRDVRACQPESEYFTDTDMSNSEISQAFVSVVDQYDPNSMGKALYRGREMISNQGLQGSFFGRVSRIFTGL